MNMFSKITSAGFSLLLIVTLLVPTSFVSASQIDPVIEWNTILLNFIREENTTPPTAARELAIVHVAIYEAVNSINKTHEPYDIILETAPNASAEAAAITASYHTLLHLYPNYAQTLTNLKNESLSNISTDKDIAAGIAVGRKAAEHILELRENDNHNATVEYTPKAIPGTWEPTLPNHAPPLYPHWNLVIPFSKTDLKQFFPPGPPALDTPEYAREVFEVQKIGGKDSTERTADQTEIAHFWEDGPGTFTPPGHWNVLAQDIAQRNNYTLAQNARLFALLNIAESDSAVLCWDTKYTFDLWRPITAIQNADIDGNPLTVKDPTWEPLLNTPPFPEYTSGHSTFSGAASAVLAAEFGDNVEFSAYDIRNPHIVRSFSSFSEAAQEAVKSRLYGGIHFRSGNQHGLTIGRNLGEHVVKTMLVANLLPTIPPTPEPSHTPVVLSSKDTAQDVPVTAKTGSEIPVAMLAIITLCGTVIGVRASQIFKQG